MVLLGMAVQRQEGAIALQQLRHSGYVQVIGLGGRSPHCIMRASPVLHPHIRTSPYYTKLDVEDKLSSIR